MNAAPNFAPGNRVLTLLWPPLVCTLKNTSKNYPKRPKTAFEKIWKHVKKIQNFRKFEILRDFLDQLQRTDRVPRVGKIERGAQLCTKQTGTDARTASAGVRIPKTLQKTTQNDKKLHLRRFGNISKKSKIFENLKFCEISLTSYSVRTGHLG